MNYTRSYVENLRKLRDSLYNSSPETIPLSMKAVSGNSLDNYHEKYANALNLQDYDLQDMINNAKDLEKEGNKLRQLIETENKNIRK